MPAINTNSLVTVAAELEDGSRIVGQNEISHPSQDSAANEMLPGSYTPASTSWSDHDSRTGPSSRSRNDSMKHLQLPYADLRSANDDKPKAHSGLHCALTPSLARAVSTELDDDDDELSVIARTKFDLEHQQDVDEGEQSCSTNPMDWPSTRQGNILFSKSEDGTWVSLPAKIKKIIYLNTYGQATFPAPSSAFLSGLENSDVLVYSCG